jgi:mannose-6-phosphate isomerase-like protein (cupin superfamily)
MTALAQSQRQALDPPHAFDITGAKARLSAADSRYEIVHESTRLQICVYALVAPEPDHQRVNTEDELYIVLEGSGMLDVEGEQLELREGHAAFVPAGADHRFSAYENLTVLAILEGERDDAQKGGGLHKSEILITSTRSAS